MFVNAASVKPRSRDMNRPIVLGTERLIILDCSAVIIKRGYGDVKEGGSKKMGQYLVTLTESLVSGKHQRLGVKFNIFLIIKMLFLMVKFLVFI